MNIKIGSSVDVQIVGIRFEYNDTQISCIGRLYSDENTMDEEDNEEEEHYNEEEDEMEIEEEVIIPVLETKPKENQRV